METSVNQRVKMFLAYTGDKQKEVALKLGTTEQTISGTLTGRSTPKADLIAKLAIAYPELSTTWLLTGQGEMVAQSKSEQNQNPQSLNFYERLIGSMREEIKMLRAQNDTLLAKRLGNRTALHIVRDGKVVRLSKRPRKAA